MHQSLQARLYERLNEDPDGRALAFYDPSGASDWLSRADLYHRSCRTAARLVDHGLREGDVCIIVLPSGETAARTVLATLLVGAVPLLVAPPVVQGSLLDLPRILKHTAERTQARLVVCDASIRDARSAFDDETWETLFLFVDEASEDASDLTDLPRVLPEEHEVAAMQLTSGTTGFPRICVWSQKGVLAALDGMEAAMRLDTGDICFNWTPLYHDMGLVNNFLLCLTAGVPLVLMSPHEFVKRPALWLRGLSDTRATITWSPNFGFAVTAQRVRDAQLEGVALGHVRAFWNAAERIHLETIEAFLDRFGAYGLRASALKTNFGCAENVGGATFSDVDGEIVVELVDRKLLYEERIARPVSDPGDDRHVVSVVSAGRPHPFLKVHILSEDGERLPDGHVGEVALETPSRMLEYLDDPESTRRATAGGLLRTGDLGYVRGDELFWVGRVKERITVRGKKLDPSDFEPVLFDIDGLREGCFVVFGVDDAELGTQQIVVVSEVREPLERNPEEIIADVHRQTFMRLGVTVNDVVLVRSGTLAKTSSGKRRHRHFRELYRNGTLDPFLVRPASVA